MRLLAIRQQTAQHLKAAAASAAQLAGAQAAAVTEVECLTADKVDLDKQLKVAQVKGPTCLCPYDCLYCQYRSDQRQPCILGTPTSRDAGPCWGCCITGSCTAFCWFCVHHHADGPHALSPPSTRPCLHAGPINIPAPPDPLPAPCSTTTNACWLKRQTCRSASTT